MRFLFIPPGLFLLIGATAAEGGECLVAQSSRAAMWAAETDDGIALPAAEAAKERLEAQTVEA